MSDETIQHSALLELTSDIVAAHVSNNPVPIGELPGLIETVYGKLSSLSAPAEEPQVELKPAVNPKRSVTDDYIICLEDGKRLKMLKRHLKTAYDLTPDEYRKRWGLPADYPMVAPEYARRRSDFAKKIGLGKSAE